MKVFVGKCDPGERGRRECGTERVKVVQCVGEAHISCALRGKHGVGCVLEDSDEDIVPFGALPPLALALVV